jgi:hypothetical protein
MPLLSMSQLRTTFPPHSPLHHPHSPLPCPPVPHPRHPCSPLSSSLSPPLSSSFWRCHCRCQRSGNYHRCPHPRVITVHARGGQKSQLHAVTNGADPRPDQDSQLPIKPSTLNAELDKATEAVYKIIEERKEFFLTSTVIGGAFAIRVASANPLAEEEYVRKVFAQLVDAAEQVLGEGST